MVFNPVFGGLSGELSERRIMTGLKSHTNYTITDTQTC